jgi:hypothetical protein
MPVSNFEPHQLRLVEKLDKKFEAIMKEWEAKPKLINTPEKSIDLSRFFQRILEVYNILLNKYIFNDDFLLFKVENIVQYTLGGSML